MKTRYSYLEMTCLIGVFISGVAFAATTTKPSYWQKDPAKMKGWVQDFGCDQPMREWSSFNTKRDVDYKIDEIKNMVDDCRNYVEWATQDRLSPDTDIKCYNKTFKFKDVKEKVCEAFFNHAAKLSPELAEKDNACKSVRDVLSADKLSWFTGEAVNSSNPGCSGLGYFFGKGGRALKTPEDFKNEPVWFKYTVDKSGVIPRWNMLRIPFNGMKEAGPQTKTNGPGTQPPSSAYE